MIILYAVGVRSADGRRAAAQRAELALERMELEKASSSGYGGDGGADDHVAMVRAIFTVPLCMDTPDWSVYCSSSPPLSSQDWSDHGSSRANEGGSDGRSAAQRGD